MPKQTVKHLMFAYKVSEIRAYRAYVSIAWDQAYLIKLIREISTLRIRYGYHGIYTLHSV
jgi:hypothetical protein